MDFLLLGKRIREERLALRLTLENLAEKIDKSINFVGQIERGEGRPSVETLVDIANALGTTIDSLMHDNTPHADDIICREINALIASLDDTGRQFILDTAKRYAYYHRQR